MMGRLLRLLPWLTLLGLVTLWHMQPTVVQIVRLKTFDIYQHLWPRPTPVDSPITIIDIDEKSLAALGQWPWPRTDLAKLVTQAFNQGVSALAFDVVFAEPDRTSPERVVQDWPLPDTEKHRLSLLPRNDTQFTAAVADKPIVLGYALDNRPEPDTENDFDLFSDVTGADLLSLPVPRVNALVRNLPALEDNAPTLGWFGYLPDQDNIVRRLPLLVRYQDALFAPLAIKLLRAHSRTPTLEPVRDATGTMTGLAFGEYTVPTGPDASYWLHFRPHDASQYVSAIDVLNGTAPTALLRGKMAIVGVSAEGLLDMRATPLAPKVPGVDIHVQLIENILLHRFLQRPGWLPWLEHGLTLLLGALLLIGLGYLGAGISSVLAVVGLGTMPLAGGLAFHYGFLVDALLPSALLLVVFALATLLKYAREERERKAIRGAFSHYLSPDMVKLVSQNPDQLQLGGMEKDLTVLFCDIRSFTSLSENFAPQELTAFLNAYLTPMTDTILQQQGTIDKYMGDAIMAFWNAPLDVPDHPRQACAAVLAMLTRLSGLNTAWEKQGLPGIRVGIGLHTGPATVGNMGSQQRFDYTVMGDTVNLASRLEGLCKPYGVQVAVSDDVRRAVPDGTFLPLDTVIVKGKSTPVAVFELLSLAASTVEQQQQINAMKTALAAYKKQEWEAAEAALAEVTDHEPLVALYRARIAAYRHTPPPADWNGVWERTEK